MKYMNVHPGTKKRSFPQNMFKRFSNLSSSQNICNNTAEYYNRVLVKAHYNSKMKYIPTVDGEISNMSHSNINFQTNSIDAKLEK